jgi:hypothetical protein
LKRVLFYHPSISTDCLLSEAISFAPPNQPRIHDSDRENHPPAIPASVSTDPRYHQTAGSRREAALQTKGVWVPPIPTPTCLSWHPNLPDKTQLFSPINPPCPTCWRCLPVHTPNPRSPIIRPSHHSEGPSVVGSRRAMRVPSAPLGTQLCLCCPRVVAGIGEATFLWGARHAATLSTDSSVIQTIGAVLSVGIHDDGPEWTRNI